LVHVCPAKIATGGRSVADVRARSVAATVDSPKGTLDSPLRDYTIYANDQITTAKEWNDVIIAYRNGGPIRVRDIGTAVAGPEDVKQAAWSNGKRGIFLVIFKQPGANVIDTVDRIKAALPHLELALPPAIKVDVVS